MKYFLKLEFLYFAFILVYLISVFFKPQNFLNFQTYLVFAILFLSFCLIRTATTKSEEMIKAFQLNVRAENEKKDTYVATIIHDLKNPLIAQTRMLESLIKKQKRMNINNDVEILQSMLSSARMLFEMVSSILNTYKYADCEIKYNFKKLNIVDIVKSVCSELTYLSEDENALVIDCADENIIVVADGIHLRRVISNLVSNALHYRKEGSSVKIVVSSDVRKNEFKITNVGYHIPVEKQKELFEKYISKSSKFNSFGTGLGLYISKRIINAHKGEMFVNSTKDGINTFGFNLPKIHFINFVEAPKITDDIIEV